MHRLTKRTRCACCGEYMEPGAYFRWCEKQLATGSRTHAGTRTVFRAAHCDALCWQRIEQLRALETVIRANRASIESLAPFDAPAEVIALFQANIHDAQAKLAELQTLPPVA